MLAREDFGRRHQRGLPAASIDGRGREQRHHGLARADVALQQAQHAFGLGEIGDDLGDRARLRRRERIGQRLDELFAQVPGRRVSAGRPAAAGARAPARARAGRRAIRHRRAATRPVSPARRRPARPAGAAAAQRLGERRKPLARQPARVLPFRQLGHAVERRVGRLRRLVEAQALGQRIDRLDQRQLGEVGLRDHAVGMHHLQHAVVERDRARDVAPLADRQQLLQDSPCAR